MSSGPLSALKDKMARLKSANEDLTDELAGKDNVIEQLKEQHERDEQELHDLQRKLIMKEDELDTVSSKLTEVSSKLAEAQHSADESDRSRRALENRSITDEDRMERLESSLKEMKYCAEDAERKYDEVSRKVLLLEAELERTEEKYNTAEYQRKSQAEELNVYISSLKSLQSKSEQAADKELFYEQRIEVLTANLREQETRCEEAVHTLESAQKAYDQLEAMHKEEKDKSAKLQCELQQVCQDLADM